MQTSVFGPKVLYLRTRVHVRERALTIDVVVIVLF